MFKVGVPAVLAFVNLTDTLAPASRLNVPVVTLAVLAAVAYVAYKYFVKNLAKCYDEDDCDDFLLEEDDSCECECVQCDSASL